MASTPLPNIHHLPPPASDQVPLLVAYSIRLSGHVVSHLRASAPTYAPKLVVKQGKFFLRVSPDTVYPLTQVPENLTVDIYDLRGANPRYNGRIESRLTVNTECAPPPQYSNSKLVINYTGDDKGSILQKVLVFMALGPSSLENLCKHTHLKEDDPLIQQYLQKYNPNDQFTKDDVFPYNPHDIANTYICKDRAYKELRVYNSAPATVLSLSQRSLIIHNINRALTRLGFLDTHPLRNKLTSASAAASALSAPNSPANTSGVGGGGLSGSTPMSTNSTFTKSSTANAVTPSSALGGGLLKVRKEVSPKKKQTSSSLASSSTTASSLGTGNIPASIPQRPVTPKLNTPPPSSSSRKRIRTMSSASSSSSEDERVKRVRADPTITIASTSSSTTSPSSLDEDANIQEDKKPNYFEKILDKFHRTYSQYQALYAQLDHAINGVAGGTSTPMALAASINGHSQLSAETKKNLGLLFEWHNSLSQWKRVLWNHQRDKQKSKEIMNLTKHKKSASLSSIQVNNGSQTPSSSSTTTTAAASAPTAIPSGLSVRASYSVKAHSASPGLTPTVKRSRITPKMSLNY